MQEKLKGKPLVIKKDGRYTGNKAALKESQYLGLCLAFFFDFKKIPTEKKAVIKNQHQDLHARNGSLDHSPL